MRTNFTISGGVEFGNKYNSYPFAKLSVDNENITIRGMYELKLSFAPSDIVFIEPFILIPGIGQGIRIYHTKQEYNYKLIFWSTKPPHELLMKIRETGFKIKYQDELLPFEVALIEANQKRDSFFNILMLIIIILLGSSILKFVILFFPSITNDKGIVVMSLVSAMATIVIICAGLLNSKNLQSAVLNKGKSIQSIKVYLKFLILLLLPLLLILLLI